MEINNELIKQYVYNTVRNKKYYTQNVLLWSGIIENYITEVEILRILAKKAYLYIRFNVKYIELKNRDNVISKYDEIIMSTSDYLEMIRDEKLNNITKPETESKIREKLNEYLEFDSDELFRNKFNLIRIFGGAIRDIIASQEIHDIDILCGSKAHKYLEYVLENKGYIYMEALYPKDLANIYTEIHVINEPHTWVKGTKIVQLIRPATYNNINFDVYQEGFNRLISNVDLSCCGLSYDGEKLYEDIPGAISHAQMKVFSVNKNGYMCHPTRLIHRKIKLTDRGWKEIEAGEAMNRDVKIANVLGDKLDYNI